ncbi:hypothetical protein BSKO_09847 [Bryopsis sp. KO-2023]|nr:hypothetical protein BSKO_09847 [Bryopsis sp. KO-2023]
MMFRTLYRGVEVGKGKALGIAANQYSNIGKSPHRAMGSSVADGEVLVEQVGPCAVATLNRPKVLNALNTNMIQRLMGHYVDWNSSEKQVKCIIVKGGGGKAFCAGGDVKAIVQEGMKGHHGEAENFFKLEYRLDYYISQMQKPYISIMDGVTMGGGVGLAMNGTFRIATERTLFAMPECVIGLFPDVGASRFLNTLPSGLGMYLALTGARLKGVEVKEAGLATHYIPSKLISQVMEKIGCLGDSAIDMSRIDEVLKGFEERPEKEALQDIRDRFKVMSSCFLKDSLREVEAALEKQGGHYKDVAQDALSAMNKSSPLSLVMTLEEMKRGKHMSLRECLEMEYSMAQFCSRDKGDFFEGVRALLIDKDKNPKWKYPSIQEVPESAIEECFSRMPDTLFSNAPPNS